MLRRLARHVFTVGSAVSLVLCVAVCVLWIDSRRHARCFWHETFKLVPNWPWSTEVGHIKVTSWQGSLVVTYGAEWNPEREQLIMPGFELDTFPPPTWGYILQIDDGALLVLFVLCFVTSYNLRKLPGPRRRGLCANCGYDLRASPARCPECGREANARRGGGAAEREL
jgi:hypothetical protein